VKNTVPQTTLNFSKKISYSFNKIETLNEALTHKSFCVEDSKNIPHNERFEFLGDAILNFVIAEKLMTLFRNEAEGLLSKKRAALVNMYKLAEVSEPLELENYLRMGPGELSQGNHLNKRLHGSCVEALVGAIYLDSNFELAKQWVLSLYSDADFDIEIDGSYKGDYKSKLQELLQKNKVGMPSYEMVLTAGPAHKPSFIVSLKINNTERARAEGASKKIAEQKVAEIVYSEFSKLNAKDMK
jgi:ribonuclease III